MRPFEASETLPASNITMDYSNHQYSWHYDEASETYRRDLHGMEAAIVRWNTPKYDGVCAMISRLVWKVQATDAGDLPELLRAAWIRLRHTQPFIASSLYISEAEDRFEMVYKPAQDGGEVEKWADETLHYHGGKLSREQLHELVFKKRHLIIPAESNYRMHLFYAQDSEDEDAWDVYMLASHYMTDVRGSLGLFNRLGELIVSDDLLSSVRPLQWGNEATLLPPTLVYAAGLRKDGDNCPEDLENYKAMLGSEKQMHEPTGQLLAPITSPQFSTDSLPIEAGIILNQEMHDSLVQVSRKNGCTVTAALSAIFGLLSAKYNVVEDAKSVALYGHATDQRWRLDERHKDFFGLGIWSTTIYHHEVHTLKKMGGVLLQESRVQDAFWEVARSMRNDLKAFSTDSKGLAMFNDIVQSSSPADVYGLFPPAHIFLSSFGVFDKFISHEYKAKDWTLQVEDPACWALNHTLPHPNFTASSWKNRLRIASQHASTLYTKEHVRDFYQDLEKMVLVVARS